MASKRRHCLKQKTINPEKRQREKTIKFFKKKRIFLGKSHCRLSFFVYLCTAILRKFLNNHTMYLDQEKKKEIFGTYGKSNTDTGSPEAQIALFSYRIAHLTEHLKVNKKDHTTQRALKMLVGKRRRLLDYLIRTDITRYRAIIAKKELGIRK